jgi:hypothetical protein
MVMATKDTEARGPGFDKTIKDTDARGGGGGGGTSLPPSAADVLAHASQLGGLLVVAFIAPIAGGGSMTVASRPKPVSLATLGQLADRRDRADGVEIRQMIEGQDQLIGALATQVTALSAEVATVQPRTVRKK